MEKRSFIKTNSEAEGCGTRWRRDRSNGCTMILMYEVLSRSNRTRKERLEGKSGLLGMINMMWRIQDVSFVTFVDILPVQ